MKSTLWVHICPKNNKNKSVTYLPVVVYEEKGKPPLFVNVRKQKINHAKNQYNILMDNLEYAIKVLKTDVDNIKECPKLIFVSNNQALVSWFQKGSCPIAYKDQFSRILAGIRTIPAGSVGITNDITCLADKYGSDCYVTDSFTEETDEEEYINIVDICSINEN